MGILNLNTILPVSSKKIFHLSKLSESRIAIDASNLIYAYAMTSWKVVCSSAEDILLVDKKRYASLTVFNIFSFILRLLSYSITPIFVFDSSPKKDKEICLKSRSKKKEKAYEDIEKHKNLLNLLENEDVLEKSRTKDLLRKKLSNFPPREEIFPCVRNFLSQSGIPIVDAKYEAEECCCMLVKFGYANFVLSRDTDCLAYGVSIITKIDSQNSVEFLDLKEILSNLSLSLSSFVDLCICIGCDYNTRIPKIGPKTSLRLIQQYQTIDCFPHSLDISNLNFLRCRNLFSEKKLLDVCNVHCLSVNICREKIYSSKFLFEEFNLLRTYQNLVSQMKKFPETKTNVIVEIDI
jgi:5'-3' exonuclease